MKQPLLEFYSPTEVLQNDKGELIVKAMLQKAGIPNANGRIYPKLILEREIQKFMEKITQRSSEALGELDHPPIKNTSDEEELVNSDYATVSLDRSSHFVNRLWWEGDEVWGELLVLDEGKGKILRDILTKKIKVGISSRSLGSIITDSDGHDIIQDDLELITWDAVSNPSTFNAYILAEQRRKRKTLQQDKFLKEQKYISEEINILNLMDKTIVQLMNIE